MASQDINLLQTKSDFHPVLNILERYVPVIAVGLVSLAAVAGVLLGLAFFLLTGQRDALGNERKQLVTQIEGDVKKESLLLLVRSRLSTLSTIIETQRSFVPYIDSTLSIVKSYTLTSFALGQNNTVNVTITVWSLQDAIDVLSTVMALEKNHTITNPVLTSCTIDGDGKIELGLSYTVVL